MLALDGLVVCLVEELTDVRLGEVGDGGGVGLVAPGGAHARGLARHEALAVAVVLRVVRPQRALLGCLDELYVFITLALHLDVLELADPPVHEPLLHQQVLEDHLPVVQVQPVQVLCLYFLFRGRFRSVQSPQLRNVIKHLRPIMLDILYRIKAKVYFCH